MGSVTVRMRSLPLNLTSTFTLPQAQRLFPLQQRGGGGGGEEGFLMVSTATTTLVLRIKNEDGSMVETDAHQFNQISPTLHACVLDGKVILQVCSDRMLLVTCDGSRILGTANLSEIVETREADVQVAGRLVAISCRDRLTVWQIDTANMSFESILSLDAFTSYSLLMMNNDAVLLAVTSNQGLSIFRIVGQEVTCIFLNKRFCEAPMVAPNQLGDMDESQMQNPTTCDFGGSIRLISPDHLLAINRAGFAVFYRLALPGALVKLYLDSRWRFPRSASLRFVGEMFAVTSTVDEIDEREEGETTSAVPGMIGIVTLGSLGYPRLHCFGPPLGSVVIHGPLSVPMPYWRNHNESWMILSPLTGTVYNVDPLDRAIDLDADWPYKRVFQTDAAVARIAYHQEAHVFVALMESLIVFDDPLEENSNNSNFGAIGNSRKSLPRASTGSWRVVLLSPLSWTIVDELALEAGEVGTVLQILPLSSKQSGTTSGQRERILVGTTIVRGEDVACRGRVLVVDVVQVVPEPGRPETGVRMRLLVAAEQKNGPVQSICRVQGRRPDFDGATNTANNNESSKAFIASADQQMTHLAILQGPRLVIHQWEEANTSGETANTATLQPIAFADTGGVWTTALAAVQAYLATGDVRGAGHVGLAAFQSTPPTKLAMLGRVEAFRVGAVTRTGCSRPILAVDFLVVAKSAAGDKDEGTFMIAAIDDTGNCWFYSYAPNSKIMF